jgi:ketosteroid isomerase-like protein/uncharacterized protein YciI
MKRGWTALVCALVAGSAATLSAQPAPAAMPSTMGIVYLAFLKKGPAWSPGQTPESKAIQEAHLANIRALWEAGQMFVAGPVDGGGDLRGIFVLKAGSKEEAAALTATDPAVKAGRLVAEIVPWWVDRRALPEAGSYCATEGAQGADLPPALARVLTDYEAAWKAKDATALAALFAEDGFVLSNGRPPVRGRAAIQKHYEGAGGPLALHAFDYAVSGKTGYIIGGFSRQAGEADTGKFTLTLRQADGGRWLIVSDMDNGNQRP